MYVPLILTLHLCATFFVLARLAVRAPLAFRGVRAALLVLAIAAAWQTPAVSLLLIIPVVAANQFRFVHVPDRLDLRSLYGDSA